jgi:hypothetical protein
MLALLGYAIGAAAMTLAQNLFAIVVFWPSPGYWGLATAPGHAIPDPWQPLRAELRTASMQSSGPWLRLRSRWTSAGRVITTYLSCLSWRIAFLLELVIIAVVLSGIKLLHDVPYTGSREVAIVGSVLSILGMGGPVLGILVWREGGEHVLASPAGGAIALTSSWRRLSTSRAARDCGPG